jgi:hypothetical protein
MGRRVPTTTGLETGDLPCLPEDRLPDPDVGTDEPLAAALDVELGAPFAGGPAAVDRLVLAPVDGPAVAAVPRFEPAALRFGPAAELFEPAAELFEPEALPAVAAALRVAGPVPLEALARAGPAVVPFAPGPSPPPRARADVELDAVRP